jgi:hypothetical protein
MMGSEDNQLMRSRTNSGHRAEELAAGFPGGKTPAARPVIHYLDEQCGTRLSECVTLPHLSVQ